MNTITKMGLIGIIITTSVCGNEGTKGINQDNDKPDSGITDTYNGPATTNRDGSRDNGITDSGESRMQDGGDAGIKDGSTDSGTEGTDGGVDSGTPDANIEPIPDASQTDGSVTNNHSPTIDFPYTNLSAQINRPIEIRLEGRDADGDTLEYKFEHGDGQTRDWSVDSKTAHSYTTTGNYNLIAYARDNRRGQTSKTLSVRVTQEEVNNPPVVRLKCITDPTDDLADCTIGEDGLYTFRFRANEQTCFDFSPSYDPDGNSLVRFRYFFDSVSDPDDFIGRRGNPKVCGGYTTSGQFTSLSSVEDDLGQTGQNRTNSIIE